MLSNSVTCLNSRSLLLSAFLLAGCFPTGIIDKFQGDHVQEVDPVMEKNNATELSRPDVVTAPTEQVALSQSPRTLWDQGNQDIKNVSLEEVIFLALQNNKIIRTVAGQSPNNQILQNPNNAASVYDQAILESGVLFGNRGVEAALSDFDVQASTSMFWGRNEAVTNVLPAGGNNVAETGTFNSSIAKSFATGGSLTLNHNWNYLGTNSPGVLFPSTYTGLLSATYRHPLLAGSGTEYTRIAGPRRAGGGFLGSITGVSQGVVIARINADISLADFETNVRNMLLAVENAYWDLYLQYCLYDTAVAARKSAFESWELARKRRDNKEDEPQARDRYYETQAQVEDALTSIYTRESQLRQLMNLPVNDNSILRPADEPTVGKFYPDWATNIAEALTHRPELRKQQWNIKSLELQMKAAKNLTRPSFDFVGSYQVNGFGDRLLGEDDDDGIAGTEGLRSGYETLTQGNHTGWTLGFEFGVPLGLRSAHSQHRNLELRLLKARQTLSAQEIDISHELASAYQALVKEYATAESNYRRLQAAQELEDVLQKKLKRGSGGAAGQGTSVIDRLIRAQESVARAKSAYCVSLVNYNKALLNLKYYKGTLLRDYNVQLSEGPWTPIAYRDAFRRALQRTSGTPTKLLSTKPEAFANPVDGGFGGVPLGEFSEEYSPEMEGELLPFETAPQMMPQGSYLPAPENAYEHSTVPAPGTNLPAPGEPRELGPKEKTNPKEPAIPPAPGASPAGVSPAGASPTEKPAGTPKPVPVPMETPAAGGTSGNQSYPELFAPSVNRTEPTSGPILRISSIQDDQPTVTPSNLVQEPVNAANNDVQTSAAFAIPTLNPPSKPKPLPEEAPASKWRKRTDK